MPATNPRLAHTVRDVQDMLAELRQNAKEVKIGLEPAPTAKDPDRLRLRASCRRKGYQIGTPATAQAEAYLPGRSMAYLDKVTTDVLWQLLQELEAPVALWGRYTTLVD